MTNTYQQKRAEEIVQYFREKTPKTIHHSGFEKIMQYINSHPDEVVPYFDNSQFFRAFHKTLIKKGMEAKRKINSFEWHFNYGGSIDRDDESMQYLTSFDIEEHSNENAMFQGLEGRIEEKEINSLDFSVPFY